MKPNLKLIPYNGEVKAATVARVFLKFKSFSPRARKLWPSARARTWKMEGLSLVMGSTAASGEAEKPFTGFEMWKQKRPFCSFCSTWDMSGGWVKLLQHDGCSCVGNFSPAYCLSVCLSRSIQQKLLNWPRFAILYLAVMPYLSLI